MKLLNFFLTHSNFWEFYRPRCFDHYENLISLINRERILSQQYLLHCKNPLTYPWSRWLRFTFCLPLQSIFDCPITISIQSQPINHRYRWDFIFWIWIRSQQKSNLSPTFLLKHQQLMTHKRWLELGRILERSEAHPQQSTT